MEARRNAAQDLLDRRLRVVRDDENQQALARQINSFIRSRSRSTGRMRLVELEAGQCGKAVVSDLLGRQFVFPTESSDSSRMHSAEAQRRTWYLLALCLVLATGTFLRLPASLFERNSALSFLSPLHPNPGFNGSASTKVFTAVTSTASSAKGSANTRRSSITTSRFRKLWSAPSSRRCGSSTSFSAYLWHQVFGSESLAALHNVASFFSILALLLAVVFAWRLKGPAAALGVAALVAFAPTQIHMSQHALVDGFFAFWALFTLWMFWENLRAPRDWRWLLPYTLGLSLMVITKENAAFVFLAVLVLLVANRWLHWGEITRELLAATLIGPLLGFVILVFLAGGLETFSPPTNCP